MLYRRFGRTELAMPVFSCGGMRYQYKWQDVPLSGVPPENQANLEATIHRAIELGINHIETARGYGSSERQLGLVLPQFPRDKIIVQTKIPPFADPAEFRRQVQDSIERLQLDYIDLLGLHGVNTHELFWWATRPNGCLAAARELQKEGLVRHVGFSTHAVPELILETVRHDRDGGFDYVNLHWYFIKQENWPAIEAAHQRDMGVFIISPSDKGGMLYQPPPNLVDLCRPLHPLVFNCVFCLSHPQVHTLSLGAARPSDFELQCSALPYLEQSDQLLPPILGRLRDAYVNALGEEVADHWADGLPHWYEVPGYFDIRAMLWLRNLVLAYDMVEFGKYRYNAIGNVGHWFPGMNARHLDEWDISAAIKHSPFAERIPTWLREVHKMLYETPK